MSAANVNTIPPARRAVLPPRRDELLANRAPENASAGSAPGDGKSLAEIVRGANKWRDSYNPLRNLVIGRVLAMIEAAERGDFAELELTMRKIEKRYPVVKGLKARRLAALEELDWDVKVMDPLPAGADEAMAEKQQQHLRSRYDLIKNLTEAFGFLALAEFRGFSILQKHRFADGPNDGAVREMHWLPQWNFSRAGEFGDFYYNKDASFGIGGDGCQTSLGEANRIGSDVLPREEFVIREVDTPLYEIALIAFVNWCMARKDYAAFVEIFGLPNSIVIMPPNIPQGKEAEYLAAAEKVADGVSGALPNGSDAKFPTASVRGQSPFKEFSEMQDADVVLAGTGGRLAMLTADKGGLGDGPSGEHADAFDQIARADARKINSVLQQDFDCIELDAAFPGQPHCVYFELAANDEEDTASLITNVAALKNAGHTVEAEWLEEKTGYELADPVEPDPNPNLNPNPPSTGAPNSDPAGMADDDLDGQPLLNRWLNYDPDQPRDDDGKWTDGSGGHTVKVGKSESVASAEDKARARDVADSHDRNVPSVVTVRNSLGKATSLTVEHNGKDWVVKNQHGQEVPQKKFHSRADAKAWTEDVIQKEVERRLQKSLRDGTYEHSGNISPVITAQENYRKRYGNRAGDPQQAFTAALVSKVDLVGALITRITEMKDDAQMLATLEKFLAQADTINALVTADVTRAAHALEQITAPAFAAGLSGQPTINSQPSTSR